MVKDFFKKIAPDSLAILFFLLISFVYFFTPVKDGLVLSGHDHSGGVGANAELVDYREKTGEISRWANNLFGGMPTYQMMPEYKSANILYKLSQGYAFYTPSYVGYLFVLLLGFYILLRAFNFKPLLAALGAVAWAFSSYYLILIQAGHIWKLLTLAYIPPTIAGVVLCYRGKLLWGGLLTGIFGAIQIMSNHPQMSYYFGFVILALIIAYAVKAKQEKAWAKFGKSTVVVILAGVVAILCNLSNLYHTYEYTKETMRGKQALQLDTTAESAQNNGLEIDYLTQWSYGKAETWSLLVPNVMGGATGSVMNDEAIKQQKLFPELTQHIGNTYQLLSQQAPQYVQQTPGLNTYWGDQPFTAGPVYVGAIICFLFVLGLFLVKSPLKWALVGVTVFSFFMAWGKNFMPFTEFMVNCFPFYNKFRAVSSGLVIAEFTFPLLALFALKLWIEKAREEAKADKYILFAYVLTGGSCVLIALFPELLLGNLLSQNEENLFNLLAQAGVNVEAYRNCLITIRESVVASDAWRSFGLITLAFVLMMLYKRKQIKSIVLAIALLGVCLLDLWSVDKRYLNDSSFTKPLPKQEQIAKTFADEQILQDSELGFRVLNLSTNTFNENNTSYFHRSIGGYSPVKLRAYQDLIDNVLQSEIPQIAQAISQTYGNLGKVNGDSLFPVLNMLDTKYVIIPTGENKTLAVQNPWSLGNAWFVQDIKYVNSDREEMISLKKLNTKYQAVANISEQESLGEAFKDTTATVQLTKLLPNELHYEIDSKLGGILVFSEIYYPGWKATLDGKSIDIKRVNYLLRAVKINDGGKHTLKFEYKPDTITITETIAFVSLLILMHLFNLPVLIVVKKWWKNRKKNKQSK